MELNEIVEYGKKIISGSIKGKEKEEEGLER